MLQTICVTGIGESFSNCSSTIARVSLKSLRGNWATRRNTCSEDNQATLSLRYQSERQSLATSPEGKDSPARLVCCRFNTKPPSSASNRQRCRASAPTCSTLQAWTFGGLFTGREASEGACVSAAAVWARRGFTLNDLNRKNAANARQTGTPM